MLSKITKTLIATCLLSKVAEAFEVAAYWGQNSGNDQGPLRDYCDSTTADIIVVSFVSHISPLQINLSNQCGLTFPDGLLHCSATGQDITYCQSQGKKVLLSVGGAGTAGFTSDAQATTFAGQLWNKFGGGSDPERPFDGAVVDGFDIDLEKTGQTGTVAFGNALRSLYAKDSSKTYYLSAAPQCPTGSDRDQSLDGVLSSVPLDFTFVQFYNNPECQLDGNFNFNDWSDYVNKTSPNKNNKIFVGLPGASSVGAGDGHVDASLIQQRVDQIKCDPNFGGISLWDASSTFPDGYAAEIREILDDANTAACHPASTAAPTTAPTTAPTVAPTVAPTTAPVVPTIIPSAPYGNSSIVTSAPADATVTDIHTTVVTITSCSDHVCTKVPVTTGLTTVTDSILNTVYTTYCPLDTETVTNPTTTLVTLTECADNKCNEKEVDTTITSTEVNTYFTTSYASVAPVETTPVAPVVTVTSTPVAPVVTVTSTSTAVAPDVTVSSTPVAPVVTVTSAPAAPVETEAETSSFTTVTLYSTVNSESSSTAAPQPPAISSIGMASSMKGSIVLVALSILASLF